MAGNVKLSILLLCASQGNIVFPVEIPIDMPTGILLFSFVITSMDIGIITLKYGI